MRMLVCGFAVHACSKLLLACRCADSRNTCTVSHLPVRVVYCLFRRHLSSRKCEGLKGNFNTFLILSPLFTSASIPVTLVIGFSLRPIIIAATSGTTRKITVRKIVTFGKFKIGFFSFREVFVSRREAVRNPVIP